MKSLLVLSLLLSSIAFAEDAPAPSVQVLKSARVQSVTCHEQQHAGHDWSSMAEVRLFVPSTATSIDAAIMVSRFGDFDQLTRQGKALCNQLKALKNVGKVVDILYRDEAGTKAIKGATTLLTDEDPFANG